MTRYLPTRHSPLIIGTRGSPLAMAQAHEVRDRLSAAFDIPTELFEIRPIATSGDNRGFIASDTPLKHLGGKGLFTREIEHMLLGGYIDIAVHSMKDMPVEQPDGLELETFLPREDPRDALVSVDDMAFDHLPYGSVAGTSSLRRRAQVLSRYPHVKVVDFRGNVQTRLKKLESGAVSCTFLAIAGLNRLGCPNVAGEVIQPEKMLPAVAQGAIGIERRTCDIGVAGMLEAIHDTRTGLTLKAERAFLAKLDGSCQTPMAGLAELIGGGIRLRGEILRPDGSERHFDDMHAPACDAEELGIEMATRLLEKAGSGFFDWKPR
ncbi:MAG: hydroxymethylbilane synthase [Roseovarius sp.]|nr:hydroxymethylbilane synthase [Roseovarius sp.]